MLSKDERKRYLHTDSQDTGKKNNHENSCENVSLSSRFRRNAEECTLVERKADRSKLAMIESFFFFLFSFSSSVRDGETISDKELLFCLQTESET